MCKFCDGQIRKGQNAFVYFSDLALGWTLELKDFEFSMMVAINYCPFCGRKSDRERSRRYREVHPDRVKAKRDRFYAKMMADPEMRERYYARGKRWRDAHKNDPAYKARLKINRAREKRVFHERHGFSRNWWFNVRRRLRPFGGEHTLWLMDGCIKVNMGRAA